jgi:hypothetical protein
LPPSFPLPPAYFCAQNQPHNNAQPLARSAAKRSATHTKPYNARATRHPTAARVCAHATRLLAAREGQVAVLDHVLDLALHRQHKQHHLAPQAKGKETRNKRENGAFCVSARGCVCSAAARARGARRRARTQYISRMGQKTAAAAARWHTGARTLRQRTNAAQTHEAALACCPGRCAPGTSNMGKKVMTKPMRKDLMEFSLRRKRQRSERARRENERRVCVSAAPATRK